MSDINEFRDEPCTYLVHTVRGGALSAPDTYDTATEAHGRAHELLAELSRSAGNDGVDVIVSMAWISDSDNSYRASAITRTSASNVRKLREEASLPSMAFAVAS